VNASIASAGLEAVQSLDESLTSIRENNVDGLLPNFLAEPLKRMRPFKDELERAEQALIDLHEAGLISNEKLKASTDDLKLKYEELKDAIGDEQFLKLAQDIAGGIGDAFGSAFSDVVFGAKTAKEAALEFTQTVAKLVFERAVVTPIVDIITSSITSMFTGAASTGVVLQSSAATAGATLQAAGAAAGSAILAQATAAAAVLKAASAASAVSGAAGAVGGGVNASGSAASVIAAAAANGAVYNRGVMAFASGGILENAKAIGGASSGGGVLNGPHAFPLQGGMTGIAGEAGPEAIMPLSRQGGTLTVQADMGNGQMMGLPLTRGKNGRLGVRLFQNGGVFGGRPADADLPQPSTADRSFGGSNEDRRGGGVRRTTAVTINIRTPSVDSFLKSQPQLARSIKKFSGQ